MANYTFPWTQVNSLVQEVVDNELKDEVYFSNAYLTRARQRMKRFNGGRAIQVDLVWKVEGQGGGWFSGTDQLGTMVVDTIQAAIFTPKNAYVELAFTYDDLQTVQGPQMIRPLLETKLELVKNTMKELLGAELYNSGSNAKAITGLQYSLRDWTTTTASGTAQSYGGITRQQTAANTGTNLWWLHGGDPTAYTAGTSFPGTGFSVLGAALAQIKLRSGKKPTMILSNVGSWTAYHNALTLTETYEKSGMRMDKKLFDSGFDNIMYRGAAWVSDEKAPRDASKIEKVYLVNEDSFRLWVQSGEDMRWDGFRKPHNQMGQNGYVIWRGEAIFGEPRANFVISAVDTSAVS